MCALIYCFSTCSKEKEEMSSSKPEITIESDIVTNGFIFSSKENQETISFTTNNSWILEISTSSDDASWCTASVTQGHKGDSFVLLTVSKNNSSEDRSAVVTIKSGTAIKSFNVIQKGCNTIIIGKDKYTINQQGGYITIEVKTNIYYSIEISDNSKSWIRESSTRSMISNIHTFIISPNNEYKNREGEIFFRSEDVQKVVKVYQENGAYISVSQELYNVNYKGGIIAVDIKSNTDFNVLMPKVDWITAESSSKNNITESTFKFAITPNDDGDKRSAEIVFYDKNNNLKVCIRIIQTGKTPHNNEIEGMPNIEW